VVRAAKLAASLAHAVAMALLLVAAWPLQAARAADDAADAQAALRKDIGQVVVAGPSWETFTNPDGTGLYHETLNALFGRHGIPVARRYMPSERARLLVTQGQVDMQTCYGFETIAPPLLLPRHPMYEGRYAVFFSRSAVPDWRGVESMRGRTVAWRLGYYNDKSLPVPVRPIEVKSGESALNMVLLGRADFYLEDTNLLDASLRRTAMPFDPAAYRIEPVGERRYYPVFNDSPRGRRLLRLYDEGMARMARSGELRRIFKKWGHRYPDYATTDAGAAGSRTARPEAGNAPHGPGAASGANPNADRACPACPAP
jgi:hypothetical protein